MRWPRLHFGDGGTFDDTPISEWDTDWYEAQWRAVHVKVEWLRSPKGRLDRALGIVAPEQQEGSSESPSPE